MGPEAAPFRCLVALPLGRALVSVDRRGLTLTARGGFEARWATTEEGHDALQPEAFRQRLKGHLRAVSLLEENRDPPRVTLNLASHQLLEDVLGWSKLNAGRR